VFNIIIGQLIAIGLVSGGIFTKNLQGYGLNTPILQLTFMYFPLSFYLIYHFRCKGTYSPIPFWQLLCASLVDSHATVLIVYAYRSTSITSVMIIEDFSVPSAVILSLVFLKVKYGLTHYVGILVCIIGISIGFINDFMHLKDDKKTSSAPILGDLLALTGAFLYALENVIQEHLIKKRGDVFNFLGFIGLFGTITTFLEAWAAGEFEAFNNIKPGVSNLTIASNYIGMALVNFICYTIIPFFIARSGATLLNLSNVTTIVWSMLSDILLFNGSF